MAQPTSSSINTILLLALTKTIILITSISSSSSSTPSYTKNYNAYNYDLTTPQFTPDGRLLQVEYAHASTKLSSPMILLPYKQLTNEKEEMCIIMATCHDLNKNRKQNRIITIPISTKSSICIGLNGVVADNISLLQRVKEQISSFTRWYGMYSPFVDSNHDDSASHPYVSIQNVVTQIGNSISTACQKCSFGGGIRPYGASIAICGIDENGVCSISITYPSGSVVKLKPNKRVGAFVIGGSDKMKNDIYKKLNDVGDVTLKNVLRTVVKILLDCNEKEDATLTKDSIENGCYNSLELVVLKSNGVFRLDESHVAKILKSLD